MERSDSMTRQIPKKKPTLCDGAIFAVMIALTVISFVFILSPGKGASYAKITTGDDVIFAELDKSDYKFDFESGGYHYTAFVNNGDISIISADCPNKECVMSRAVGTRPGSIVCVPGKVIITCCEEVNGVDGADIIVP